MTNIHQLTSYWLSEVMYGVRFIAALLIGGSFIIGSAFAFTAGLIYGSGLLMGAW